MSDFRDLMIAQMDDAAAAFAAEDFAAGYGRGVVGRVRRRRTVRAVGVGGVSAVAVGGLAFGGSQLFSDGVQPAGFVTPSPDPSRTAGPEGAVTPFECGFVFDTNASNAPHLAVTAWQSTTPGGSTSMGDNSVDSVWTDGLVDTSANAAHGVAEQSLGNRTPESEVSGRDPGDPAVWAERGGPIDGTHAGVGFVSVRDDVVVGTQRLDFTAGPVPFAVTGIDEGKFAASLSQPESAFVPCPGEEPSDVSVDVYFVVSAVTMKRGDPNPVAGPEYAWAHIGGFRSDVPSNYIPSN